ncbi:hypothetical protein [Actinomadura sp. 7K534]|uniref:hypothetical protein n=1 Tax=Actinomadura sp. 7K534 TaxID=2530366 RepID=UPI001050746E|nr:hypothetical protein [Actinomadura sp. 7K534]TDB89955.1 hypothetical protein E1266_28850 [Actinomadura sp. 7K534]
MDRPDGIDRRTFAHRIATDVDRVAPLLARILLARAVWNIRHHCGAHSLWVAKDVAADCREELKAAGATTQELAHTLVPDHDCRRDLTTAIAGTARLSAAITGERSAYARYSLATDPDISIDKKRAGELGDDWQEQQDHVRNVLRGLPKDLGNGKSGSLLLDRAIDRVFKRGLYYQTRHYLFSREPERVWRRRVSGVLHGAACVRLVRGDAAAASGDLAGNIRGGRRALDDTAPSVWARQAASRLEEAVLPVFTGQEPLTAHKVTATRLTALCLACELDAARIPAAGDLFRGVVVKITQMEQDTDWRRSPIS